MIYSLVLLWLVAFVPIIVINSLLSREKNIGIGTTVGITIIVFVFSFLLIYLAIDAIGLNENVRLKSDHQLGSEFEIIKTWKGGTSERFLFDEGQIIRHHESGTCFFVIRKGFGLGISRIECDMGPSH